MPLEVGTATSRNQRLGIEIEYRTKAGHAPVLEDPGWLEMGLGPILQWVDGSLALARVSRPVHGPGIFRFPQRSHRGKVRQKATVTGGPSGRIFNLSSEVT